MAPAWQRLAFDELVASQLALALVRGSLKRGRGTRWQSAGMLRAKIEAALPFSLTGSQREALAEIERDLAGETRMLRLLQGDVGSGKTIVALIAMADVVEAGGQAALMAPTELLARQHFSTIAPLAEKAGIEAVLLTGAGRGGERSATLSAIADGAAKIVIGTHALFQAGVEFQKLGLVVVDEQHRFGVHQRLALSGKGSAPDTLVMTATPIPRTLVLSYFGDMDVSKLTEKPAGRQPIDTRAVPLLARRGGGGPHRGRDRGRRQGLLGVPARRGIGGQRPRSRGEPLRQARRSLRAARRACARPHEAGARRTRVMERFRAGDIAILVATTVIEVGVDVPDATIMVIEHAERFGLAQLHQLRGRVGRGAKRSVCLLLYRAPLGETAKARLSIMRETEDGFRIAEEDLQPARRRRRARHATIRDAGLSSGAAGGARRAAGSRARRGEARARPRSGFLVGARRGAPAAALYLRSRRGGAADAGGVELLPVDQPYEVSRPSSRMS